jgi:hypothetical protein
MRLRAQSILVGLCLAAVGCGDEAPATTPATTAVSTAGDERFPDVLAAEATYDDADATWSFEVTISSPYDTPQRYADGWRVVGPDGTVYGVHTLTHDHAGEQPFTRTQRGVAVPNDVDEVTIEGRDLANGFGGATVTVDLRAATS